jgi:phytoene dehydrogenase-like protein
MKKEAVIIGTGMGSLSTGAILAKNGWKVHLVEQNWIPGGCTTSYPRKNYIFEAGATTIVGLDHHMPLKFLLDYTGINIPMRKLKTPMEVYMGNEKITKHNDIHQWIDEAENRFEGNQRKFWKEAFKASEFVWNSSMKYLSFPPSNFQDILQTLKKVNPLDVIPARYALQSTEQVMKKHKVYNKKFLAYVNEQLMITAQNTAEDVNFLFGAAALCYTNYENYYIDGGLRNLVQPFVDYIIDKGGTVTYREPVQAITKENSGFTVRTKTKYLKAERVISGIPLNDTKRLFDDKKATKSKAEMQSPQLNSAFQMGIAFKSTKQFDCLHHQIHLEKPLSEINATSLFVSLSHPEDTTRAPENDTIVASVSTHWPDPENKVFETTELEKEVLAVLEEKGFLKKNEIKYYHSSSPKSWKKWTGRKWGFVGGYPQFMKIKPWQLNDSRLGIPGAYQVGDSVYPGQGIPGVTLGGIVAARKLLLDAKQPVDF